MNVYISSTGEVQEVEVVKETPKGWRVRTLGGYKMEFMAYRKAPNGYSKTFEDLGSAIDDALQFILDQERKAREVKRNMFEKRKTLHTKYRDAFVAGTKRIVPECFGKSVTDQEAAENCCSDCPIAVQCRS